MAACPACIVCDGFGFVRNTAAAAFDVFYWLQVTGHFGDMPLLQSAPNRLDYIDILQLWLHGQIGSSICLRLIP